jgi:hypothetical protein
MCGPTVSARAGLPPLPILETDEKLSFSPVVGGALPPSHDERADQERYLKAKEEGWRVWDVCARKYVELRGSITPEQADSAVAALLMCTSWQARLGIWGANAAVARAARIQGLREGADERVLWEDAAWELRALVEAVAAVRMQYGSAGRKRKREEGEATDLVAACAYWVLSMQKFEATFFDPSIPPQFESVCLFLTTSAAARSARRVALAFE